MLGGVTIRGAVELLCVCVCVCLYTCAHWVCQYTLARQRYIDNHLGYLSAMEDLIHVITGLQM